MKKMADILERITQVKREMAELGPMRPGSLSKQKRAWGKTYWHLSYYHRGQGHTAYVSEDRVKAVRSQIANYKRFQELCKILVDRSLELAKLADAETKP